MRQSDIKKVSAMLSEAHALNAKSRRLEQEALQLCTCPESHSHDMDSKTMCTICKNVSYSVDMP